MAGGSLEGLRLYGFGGAKGADPVAAAKKSWDSPKRQIPDVLDAVYKALENGTELEEVALGIVAALKRGNPELFKQLVERRHGKVPEIIKAEHLVPQLVLRDRTQSDVALPELPEGKTVDVEAGPVAARERLEAPEGVPEPPEES